MRRHYLNYNLENGFINNWLAAGPQEISFQPNQQQGGINKSELAHNYYQSESGITTTPVERGPLTKGLFQVGDYQGSWSYYVCKEDHQVDFSRLVNAPRYLRSWAYTQLSSKLPQEVLLLLTTHGPADLWLNGEHIHRQEHFSEQRPESVSIHVSLKKGVNKIVVRFEAVAIRACPYALALQVCKPTGTQEPYPPESGIHVTIPTLIEDIKRRNKFEHAMVRCYTGQEVFEPQEKIRLFWPEELENPSPAVVRLQTTAGQIHAEATVDGTQGDELILHSAPQIPSGPYRIRMMPLQNEFYDHNLRITHEIPIWNLGRQAYSDKPYGSYAQRCQEALVSASKWPDSAVGPKAILFTEIAKMALDRWDALDAEKILGCLQGVDLVGALGIIGMLYRFGDHEQFPKELLGPVEETIVNFSMESSAFDPSSEKILSLTVATLAGRRFPDRIFAFSGKSGQWHCQHGEAQVLEWLYERGVYGFPTWDSQSNFAEQLSALSYLVDLAESQQVRELSTAIIDKLLATLAINSYKGVFGSTHGRTSAPFVKGGLLEPTSGICRLMWGMGVFNHHIAATVSLACMQSYEIPPMISNIATVKPNEIWHRERHAVDLDQAVNKVTYRTADAMLSSAQDYRPGAQGSQEHIWQATLGGAASVFANHPACSSENDGRRPNFWAGNAILPRVAQWKDVLISIHKLPQDDWMGFTHAYFPIYAFDEYALYDDRWAFARKGDGYLALMASAGFELIRQGRYADRELRSDSLNNIWLCHLGQRQLDGDFQEFQQKVLALPVTTDHHSIVCTTLRNETLSFAWEGPFLRDGVAQALSGFKHYDSAFIMADYPCQQMDVAFGEDLLRLNFERPEGAEAT